MTDPVSTQEEEFKLGGGTPRKSKFDFEGEFEVEFTEKAITTSKNGDPMIKFTLVGLEGAAEGLQFNDYAVSLPIDGKEGELDNFRLREIMAALGDKTPRDQPLNIRFTDIMGKRVIAKFVSEEFPKGSGKRSAKIKRYLSAKSATGDSLPF